MDRLPKCEANYAALTPLTFIKRASKVYSNRTSIIYGHVRFTWQQTYQRCCRLASSLRNLNIAKNNVVHIFSPFRTIFSILAKFDSFFIRFTFLSQSGYFLFIIIEILIT